MQLIEKCKNVILPGSAKSIASFSNWHYRWWWWWWWYW